MKKMIYLFGLCTLVGLLLMGCSNENDSEYVAHMDDLKDAIFNSNGYQFQLYEDKLMVLGKNLSGKKYSFDDILLADKDEERKESSFREYENIKVKTEGANYYISGDDIAFTLTKFQNHIVVDEEGNEFIRTQLKLD